MAIRAKMHVDIASVRAVQDAFRGIKVGVQNRVVKDAVGKSARRGAKIAKSLAPRGPTGVVKRSIGTKFRSYRSRGVWVFIIGPRTRFYGYARHQPKRKYPRTVATKVAHLAERGRGPLVAKNPRGVMIFYPTPTAKYQIARPTVRRAMPRPFMAPAYSYVKSNKPQVIVDILLGIQREAARYARRGKLIHVR